MRVKLVSVQVEVLAQLLGLPEDCQIVGVRDDTNIITFKVMSPEFPEVRHPDKVEYMEVSRKAKEAEAEHWRDDDSPQAETGYGVCP